ncbi:NAD-dependent epimerase/dehydratase family protein [Myxacorys almedinensis]|uniref:NAD-dependent epimerase/dehydratase family protein n=1 Tax=Myxacorys almedinensis A TaxID=2690445 RepID=A0A8J7Z5X3_9CYAN|nr:NAD(P)-dependent oxidoreductase [Myxacorys almedinensis]NDJ16065.1 NAD-dependent epimerase/dehydratase family protein [Myxacorys almedinensis A]
MKLLITGASGFLGQYVVVEALRRGHQVRAVVRPSGDVTRYTWHDHPSVEFARVDLRCQEGLTSAIEGVDAVIHLAAAKAGDFYTQFAGTVIATENLLRAMVEAKVLRLVAISTFSVYDYVKMENNTLVTEDAPIESNPLERDEYAQTKLIQEQLVREFENTHQALVTIIRPGMVYGRDYLWNACLGAELTDTLWLRIGARATMPITYVENCATAIVLASEKEAAIAQTLNVVDDNLPTQREFAKKLLKRMTVPAKLIPVNWALMNSLTWVLWYYNKIILKGQAKFPGIFVPAKLQARFKPLQYTNAHAKEILGWTPKYSLDDAFERSSSDADLLAVSPQASPVSA